jgi:hypothetical protein
MQSSNRHCRGFLSGLALVLFAMVAALICSEKALSQSEGQTTTGSTEANAGQQDGKAASVPVAQKDIPLANPGRPTVSTPATLTPVGYLQFETGLLAAWHSPEFNSQASLGEVTKFTASQRIELLAAVGPYVHSDTAPQNGSGDVSLGVQGVVSQGEGARPTVALSYFGRVLNGGTPDIDIGSSDNSAILLISADVKGFHYDTNYLFNEVASDQGVRRAQFGQTLSVSHALGKDFGLSGEIWDFTQPFLRSHAVGNLWAVNYNAKKNLVFDAAFNRGLTGTSTRWELLTGFTYLLPHKIRLE